MNYLILIATYAFDAFILLQLMKGILGKRREQIPAPVFYGCFVLMEVLLFYYQQRAVTLSANQTLLTSAFLGVITTFLVSLLYHAPLSQQLFLSVSFQILSGSSRTILTLIATEVNTAIINLPEPKPDPEFISILNLTSKLVLYACYRLVLLLWNRNLRQYTNLQYQVLIFTTPVLSFVLMLLISYQSPYGSVHVYIPILLNIALIALTIVSYFFFHYMLTMNELNLKYQKMEQQVTFQRDKYLQLSAAYKANRSVLHDTKKHYFALSGYIKEQQYDKLQDYLQTSMEKLEESYATINTGNLVIDSFISNFILVAQNYSINFSQSISIDANKIPINDYDLCVIIGNLLDNSLNAVRKISPAGRTIQLNIEITDSNKFIIHIKNTYVPEMADKKESEASLEHGYGIENIQKIVEGNHGILRVQPGDWYEVTIVIPII